MKKCIGCGSSLQTNEKEKKGYTNKIENDYCLRCFKIKNYNILIESDFNEQEFDKNIDTMLKNEKAPVFYYVIDILDFERSRLLELEQKIKNKKVNIIINKIDLIPKSVKLSKIKKFVDQYFSETTLTNYNIFLISAYKKDSIQSLLNWILKNKNENNYFIGASNVGKSSIINKIMELNEQIPNVLVSRFFNTTLDFIRINLTNEISIIDTPGINKESFISKFINIDQQKYFFFKNELKQITYQLKSNQTIFIAGLIWIEFEFDNQKTNDVHFYNSSQIKLHRTKTINATKYFEKNLKTLVPIIAKSNSTNQNTKEILLTKNEKVDIVISGLGWFNFKNDGITKIKFVLPTEIKDIPLSNYIKIRKPLI